MYLFFMFLFLSFFCIFKCAIHFLVFKKNNSAKQLQFLAFHLPMSHKSSLLILGMFLADFSMHV